MDFHKICTAGTSKLIDVQCKFMFKSEYKILSYGHFKILVQACPRWGDGIDPDFFVHCFISQLLLKLDFWNLTCLVDGQESKSAERYVRQGNVLPMATRTKISEIVFNERPVSIFWNNMYP